MLPDANGFPPAHPSEATHINDATRRTAERLLADAGSCHCLTKGMFGILGLRHRLLQCLEGLVHLWWGDPATLQ